MPKFTGTIRHNDLEGGFYELHTDNGDIYRLAEELVASEQGESAAAGSETQDGRASA